MAWPSATAAVVRPVEFIGPVPPATPSFTPLTAFAALSRPFMFWLVAEPEPRRTTVEAGPAPVFEDCIPGMPRCPRLIALVACRLKTAIGLFLWPSATADGW